MSDSLTPVQADIHVPVPPARAFELYVNRPGRTHPAKGLSGGPTRIVYEPFAGGRWYEVGADGTEHDWGRVLAWEPGRRLALAWMVGAATGEWAFDPDEEHASHAEITFTPEGDGTRVAVEHVGFERHGAGAASIHRGVSRGWDEDLADLRRAASAPRFMAPHVTIATTDLEGVSAFYQALGLREAFRTPVSGAAVHVELELDGTRIAFATEAAFRDDHQLDPGPASHRAVVTLWTDDVDAAFALALSLGARPLAEPAPFLGRLRNATVEAPDGHALQLVQEMRPA